MALQPAVSWGGRVRWFSFRQAANMGRQVITALQQREGMAFILACAHSRLVFIGSLRLLDADLGAVHQHAPARPVS